MDDTARLDALALHGLFVAQNSQLVNGQWVHSWTCCYGIDKLIEGASLREVIDLAVNNIERGEQHATQEGLQQENDQPEHPQGEGGRETAEASGSDCAEYCTRVGEESRQAI